MNRTINDINTHPAFATIEFFLMPLLEGAVYQPHQCERIRPGRFGLVDVSVEGEPNTFHVLHRNLKSNLLALCFLQENMHQRVRFSDLPEARAFLAHLRMCETPQTT